MKILVWISEYMPLTNVLGFGSLKTLPVIDLQAGNEKLDVSTYFLSINPDPEPHPDPFL
jgi:hypothetical protein